MEGCVCDEHGPLEWTQWFDAPRFFFRLISLGHAALTRVEVLERADVAGGYDSVTARAYFEVDPTAAANRGIALIENAPRNANGRVEFWPTFISSGRAMLRRATARRWSKFRTGAERV